MNIDISKFRPSAFKGDTPCRRDLIEGRLPRGKVVLLAGAGDVGKSWLLLQLFEAINNGAEDYAFGGLLVDRHQIIGNATVGNHYACIAIMGEDDFESIDLRLKAIRRNRNDAPDHGAIIPVPNVAEPMALIKRNYDGSIIKTEAFDWLERYLESLLARGFQLGFLAIDTLSTLLPIDANKPEEVQAALSLLTGLATRYDICVIVTHHLRKDLGQDRSAEGLRAAIRGSTAVVDGVRAAYVMWKYSDEEAAALCKELELDKGSDVVGLRIVKNNLGLRSTPVAYARLSDGRLHDITRMLAQRPSPEDCMLLVIRDANQAGRTLQKSGQDGVFANRASSWPGGLGSWAKAKLEKLVSELETAGRVTRGKSGLIAVES